MLPRLRKLVVLVMFVFACSKCSGRACRGPCRRMWADDKVLIFLRSPHLLGENGGLNTTVTNQSVRFTGQSLTCTFPGRGKVRVACHELTTTTDHEDMRLKWLSHVPVQILSQKHASWTGSGAETTVQTPLQ